MDTTTRDAAARQYIRKSRQRRRAQRLLRLRIAVALIALTIMFFVGFLIGCGAERAKGPQASIPSAAVTDTAARVDVAATEEPLYFDEVTDPNFTGYPEISHTPTPAPTPAPRYRDDIVSDGRLLSYELQEFMQDCCEEYGVPYALALAIAEVETHFDPDAVSSTGDYGLMQINECNHEWLLDMGLDVMTHEGNIEAGIYIISGHLANYGEPELALMAYNCGASGARKLWAAGQYQTDYSRKVMAAFEYWTSVLEE